eukprot:954377-Prorocentrum_minimum.AAC.1
MPLAEGGRELPPQPPLRRPPEGGLLLRQFEGGVGGGVHLARRVLPPLGGRRLGGRLQMTART